MADITTNLTGHIPFTDNAADQVINALVGSNGTYLGTGNTNTHRQPGPGGLLLPYSLDFNGTDNYATSNLAIGGGTGISVAYWLYRGNWSGARYPLYLLNSTGGAMQHYHRINPGFTFDIVWATNGFMSQQYNVSNTPAINVWTHIGVSFDITQAGTSEAKYFKNGVELTKTGNAQNANNTNAFQDSNPAHFMSNFVPGRLADFRAYTRLLATDDFLYLYKMGPAGYPANSVAPSITGPLSAGSTVVCNPGTWSEPLSDGPYAQALTYTYQWYSDVAEGFIDPQIIDGATSASLIIPSNQVERWLLCEVSAANAVGSNDTVFSISVGPVTPALPSGSPFSLKKSVKGPIASRILLPHRIL